MICSSSIDELCDPFTVDELIEPMELRSLTNIEDEFIIQMSNSWTVQHGEPSTPEEEAKCRAYVRRADFNRRVDMRDRVCSSLLRDLKRELPRHLKEVEWTPVMAQIAVHLWRQDGYPLMPGYTDHEAGELICDKMNNPPFFWPLVWRALNIVHHIRKWRIMRAIRRIRAKRRKVET